jgi:hypothetical protein
MARIWGDATRSGKPNPGESCERLVIENRGALGERAVPGADGWHSRFTREGPAMGHLCHAQRETTVRPGDYPSPVAGRCAFWLVNIFPVRHHAAPTLAQLAP